MIDIQTSPAPDPRRSLRLHPGNQRQRRFQDRRHRHRLLRRGHPRQCPGHQRHHRQRQSPGRRRSQLQIFPDRRHSHQPPYRGLRHQHPPRLPILEAETQTGHRPALEAATRMALRQEREHPPGHRPALEAAPRMARIRERVLETRMALEAAIGQVGATTVPTIRGSGLNLRGEAGRLQPGTAMPFAPAPTAG